MSDKMPILAHGENYIEAVIKRTGAGTKKYPGSYEDAKNRIISDLDAIADDLEDKPEMFMPEKVICVRMEPKFEAKSYSPDPIVSAVSDGMKIIGGRKYTYAVHEETEEKAKLYYVRTQTNGIKKLKNILSEGFRDNQESWKHSIQSIRTIDLMPGKEKMMGFSQKWSEGFVEFVLHPLGEDTVQGTVDHFIRLSRLDESDVNIREYNDGLTFIAAKASRSILDVIADFNPLRSVHPICDYDENVLRSMTVEGPKPPLKNTSPEVTIGTFDSGIDDTLPYFSGYAENIDLVKNDRRNYEHGSGVTGALLYGSLRGVDSKTVLDPPREYVKMFRVLPEDGTTYAGNPEGKLGLYETIDHIEETVKKYPEIKLFNISLGPHMPIIDDELNRFTYALDRLVFDTGKDGINPLFTVACGNDGNTEINRIQPPSDMINGIAVGAYTMNSLNEPYRASYSCVGPGREGAKIKPDILEFGGSLDCPFISVSKEAGKVSTYAGTSLAAPLAMHKVAEMIADSEEISPQLARTILIQNADLPEGKGHTNEEGYGYLIKNPEEMLRCSDNKVTILYEGVLGAPMTAKLPVFSPGIEKVKGNVTITWTIATVVNPDINDVDAYSGNGIEDTFYPHSYKYTFRRGKESESLNLLEEGSSARKQKLIDNGYTKAMMPNSRAAKKYKNENELRNIDFKWDTAIKKTVTMRGSSLYEPFITVHALGRNGHKGDDVRYFMVVTIEAPNYYGSMYDEILRAYPRLEQIKTRNVNRVRT